MKSETYPEVDPTTPVTTETFPCPNLTLTHISLTQIVALSDKIQDHWGKTGQLPNKGEMMEILQSSDVEWDMRQLSVHPNDPEYEFWRETRGERQEVSLEETP